MANQSYLNFKDELDDQQPYDSLTDRDPLVDVSSRTPSPSSPSEAVKQAIMNRFAGKNASSASDDDSLDEISSDPLMMDFEKNQSKLSDYRNAKVGADYMTNLGSAFSQMAQGANTPRDNQALYSNIGKQSQEILNGAETDQLRRAKVMEAIEGRKSREAISADNLAARMAAEKERRLDRAATRESIQAEKDARLADKREEKELALAVPGYERTGEVLPKVEEAANLRKATAQTDQLVKNLKKLKGLVETNGAFELTGKDAETMRDLARDIQLTMKGPEMYNLGVLSGPDLRLLEQLTADPSSMSSLFTRKGTRMQQIDNQLESIQSKLANTVKSLGYRQAGQEPKDGPPKQPNSKAGSLVKVRGKLYRVAEDGDTLEEVM